MDFCHLIVTCLFSMLRLPFDNQKVKGNYAIFSKKLVKFSKKLVEFLKKLVKFSEKLVKFFRPLEIFHQQWREF